MTWIMFYSAGVTIRKVLLRRPFRGGYFASRAISRDAVVGRKDCPPKKKGGRYEVNDIS